MGRRKWIALTALAVAGVSTAGVVALRAADHVDSPAASGAPDADITDVLAWMSADASKVNLVMDWFPNAPSASKLAANVLFTFHVTSKATFAATTSTETTVICAFDAAENLSCWVGNADFVSGPKNANNTSASGKVMAFAGIKDDPFFFNLTGFKNVVSAVTAAAPSLTFDAAGCPALDATTSTTLVNQLKTGTAGAAAANDFAGQNIQTIVLQVDKSLLTGGGPILGVWASTNRRS